MHVKTIADGGVQILHRWYTVGTAQTLRRHAHLAKIVVAVLERGHWTLCILSAASLLTEELGVWNMRLVDLVDILFAFAHQTAFG